jgi:hypothetical protein
MAGRNLVFAERDYAAKTGYDSRFRIALDRLNKLTPSSSDLRVVSLVKKGV